MNQETQKNTVNRAKMYQLVLFPLNNGATNVYYVLILAYIATFGSNVLKLGAVFASVMVISIKSASYKKPSKITIILYHNNNKKSIKIRQEAINFLVVIKA